MSVVSWSLRGLGRKLYNLANVADKKYSYEEASDVTYGVGITLVKNVLTYCPEKVRRIFIRKKAIFDEEFEWVIKEAEARKIPVIATNDLRPSNYGRTAFISAELEKVEEHILPGSHLVLVSPALASNVGAITRTALAFGIHDIAIIGDSFDTQSPWMLRSSMGARLQVREECFPTIEDYIARFPENNRYAFMLGAASKLSEVKVKKPYSIILGNESTGLPPEYAGFCQQVFIEQSPELDSLNVSVSAALALYVFSRQ